MAPRLQLQALLEEIMDDGHVYFQPPANVQIEYPCIVYKRDRMITRFAGNNPYRRTKRYQVTIITRNPDDDILDKVAALPMCTYERFFAAENLNHDVLNLFF